jgi:hypothetical protein
VIALLVLGACASSPAAPRDVVPEPALPVDGPAACVPPDPRPSDERPAPPGAFPRRPGPDVGTFHARLVSVWSDEALVATDAGEIFRLRCGGACSPDVAGPWTWIGRRVVVGWRRPFARARPGRPDLRITSMSLTEDEAPLCGAHGEVRPTAEEAELTCGPPPRRGEPPKEEVASCHPDAHGTFEAELLRYEVGDYVYLTVRLDSGEEATLDCGRGCDLDAASDGRPVRGHRRVRWRVAPEVNVWEAHLLGPVVLVDGLEPIAPHAR